MSRKDVEKLIAKALKSAEFRQAFLAVAQEKAIRPVRSCRCVVIELPESAKPNDFAHVTPGTVTAFVAREGDPLLGRLVKSIEANDSKNFSWATEQIKQLGADVASKLAAVKGAKRAKASGKKSTRKGSEGEPRPQAFSSFAELSYANKPLVGHVHVDDLLRVHAHAFPYNGGHLDSEQFSLLEYYRADVATPLSCVLLIRQPKLSEIEREALRLVPSGSSANNVAAAAVAPLTPALLAFVVVTAEVAARWVYNEFVKLYVAFLHGKTALSALPDAVLEAEDFQHQLKSLPPEVTAAELLRLRTDMLLRKPRR